MVEKAGNAGEEPKGKPSERDGDCPLPREAMPRHIAIIMDGNGRWAKSRGLVRTRGHEAGVEAVREIVRACSRWGVEVLTLYAFSSENWSRPAREVNALMLLLRNYLRREREELHAEKVRIRSIGDIDRLPKRARSELDAACGLTRENGGLNLVLALSYGGRDEIVRAARKLARACAEGELAPEAISEAEMAGALDTAGLPDPDLLIRTAGEMRISNFLLWQASYSEYYSAEVCWPDFSPGELAGALRAYAARKRTFGTVS